MPWTLGFRTALAHATPPGVWQAVPALLGRKLTIGYKELPMQGAMLSLLRAVQLSQPRLAVPAASPLGSGCVRASLAGAFLRHEA